MISKATHSYSNWPGRKKSTNFATKRTKDYGACEKAAMYQAELGSRQLETGYSRNN